MSTWREIGKGVLLAPRRGTAPTPPPGYIPSDGDPFVAVRPYPTCSVREDYTENKKCCGTVRLKRCLKYGKRVDREACYVCGGDDTVPQSGEVSR